ncbi:MAG: alpha-L-rhamnosidase, partial [Tannerella sp.]|nr:alpha-L-rhamnosidase [Tannerella sp.]
MRNKTSLLRNNPVKTFLMLLLSFVSTTFVEASVGFSLYDLTCEQETNPLAIETQTPCFSWKIHASGRGFVQSAYQIAVATSPDALADTKGDVWDSGKTASTQSILVPLMSAKPLKPFTRYYWKVRIWNQADAVSEWSEPQTFSTGAFNDKDWGAAKWIALEKDVKNEYMSMGMADIRGGLAKRQAPD